MPHFDPTKTRPAPLEPSEGSYESKLEAAVHGIASHIVEVSRQHSRAIEDMHDCLDQIGRCLGETGAIISEKHPDTFGRQEDEIAGLAARIDFLGPDREAQAEASPVPCDADGPWDTQSAEALTRAWEMAEAEVVTAPRPTERPRAMGREPAACTRPVALPPQAPQYDRAWLEERFAGIAALLQQSLAESSPAEPLAALGRRLDQMETRLETVLEEMPARLTKDWLGVVEGHIRELSTHVETTGRQLARLDVVDEQLSLLSRAFGEQRHQEQAQSASLSEETAELLAHAAAERAVDRLAATMPASDAGSERLQALEGLMHDYVAESRRGEEVTSGILRAIEHSLSRIIDRIETMEAVAPATETYDHALEEDGADEEAKRLAEAYAAGARVLGHMAPAPTIDAADYVPQSLASRPERAPEAGSSPAEPLATLATTPSSQELKASALRGKLKAQATPEEPAPGKLQPFDQALTADRREDIKSLMRNPSRSRLLLGCTLALLFVGSYLAVDLLMKGASWTSTPQELVAEPAETPAKIGAPRDLADRPEAPGNSPASARPSGTPDKAKEQATQPVIGPQAPDETGIAAPPIQPVALSPSAVPPAPVVDGDAPSGLPMLPVEIGSEALRGAAARGDALAQFEVASRYAEGKGVPQDHRLAFAWYERAALRGLASAQFRLGAYYERGLGVTSDAERAKVWYRRAADQGYVKAMHNLAVLMVGRDSERADYVTAAHWFQAAAARGYIDSQFNLATLYVHGRGVAKDLGEAYKWFAIAARAGDAGAASRLDEVKTQLELPEREAAEAKVAAWRSIETASQGR
jgi:localization factor PodJL